MLDTEDPESGDGERFRRDSKDERRACKGSMADARALVRNSCIATSGAAADADDGAGDVASARCLSSFACLLRALWA